MKKIIKTTTTLIITLSVFLLVGNVVSAFQITTLDIPFNPETTPKVSELEMTFNGNVVLVEKENNELFVTIENNGLLIPIKVSNSTNVENIDKENLRTENIEFGKFIEVTGSMQETKLGAETVTIFNEAQTYKRPFFMGLEEYSAQL